jgi:hypothetical protein
VRVRIDQRVQEEVGEIASKDLLETDARRDVLGPRFSPNLGWLGS